MMQSTTSKSCAMLSLGRLLDPVVIRIWLGRTIPDSVLRVPAELVSAASQGSLWHLVPFAMSDDMPYPACKWRQADAHFKKGVVIAKSVHEALVYGRPFCSACYPYMPARVGYFE